VFLSVAEQSADLHGASLIRAIRDAAQGATFVGATGPKMVAEGCESVFDMTSHQAMLTGALGNAGRAYRMLNVCEQRFRVEHFDACVVIDSPMLHLPLAARAQQAGVPVLYYIAPQMWAWGRYRVCKLRHRVDRVACIMPFEEKFFREQGVDARFVGHPLADQFAEKHIDSRTVRAIRGRSDLIVALLPGSRKQVVSSVLLGQLEVARRIAAEVPGVSFGISVANDRVRGVVESMATGAGVDYALHDQDHSELIEAADLVLVASGTTTLEVASHYKPMIVMYQASRLMYHLIGRWMISTPYYSLPNILAGREVVPEFMPFFTSTEPIAARAIELLRSLEARQAMSTELAGVVRPLRDGNASANTAAMLIDMIRETGH
jgi:lipid-A-disaccharide synthase